MLRFAPLLLLISQVCSAQAQLGAAGAEYFSRDTLPAVFTQGYAAPSPFTPDSIASGDMDGCGIEDLVLGWPSLVLFNPNQTPSVGGDFNCDPYDDATIGDPSMTSAMWEMQGLSPSSLLPPLALVMRPTPPAPEMIQIQTEYSFALTSNRISAYPSPVTH